MKSPLDAVTDGIVHFTACGGAGMAPLARIFFQLGFKVTGSDLEASAATAALEDMGIKVTIGHFTSNIPDNNGAKALLVYSSAVPETNCERQEAARKGYSSMRRGEALALLCGVYKRTVGISGSHGKTSITGMLSHILRECGMNPGFMVGGKVNDWKYFSDAGNGDIFVTELDESDGTHRLADTCIGIVPNVEDDHCWSTGGVEALYGNFAKFASRSKRLIYVSGETTSRLFAFHENKRAFDAEIASSRQSYEYAGDSLPQEWGGYQVLNGSLAVAAAVELGVEREAAEKALCSFPGIDRRMSIRFKSGKIIVIEDYAHHPTELAASLSSLKECFPEKTLAVLFQPHRYARLERYIDGFAAELKKADRVFVSPVFAAWVEKGRIDSEELVRRCGEKASYLPVENWDSAATVLLESLPDSDNLLLAVIGAGDLKNILPPLLSRLVSK